MFQCIYQYVRVRHYLSFVYDVHYLTHHQVNGDVEVGVSCLYDSSFFITRSISYQQSDATNEERSIRVNILIIAANLYVLCEIVVKVANLDVSQVFL